MKKVLAVLLAALLIATLGTPLFAAPSFNLSRDSFNFAYASWERGDPYLDVAETLPNPDYVKFEIRVGNIVSPDQLDYIMDRQEGSVSMWYWVQYEGKEEGGEPVWELSEQSAYLEIEPGTFPLTSSSIANGAVLNYASKYDDTRADVVWDTIAVTPIATRTRETVNGVRYRLNQRATMAACTVSGSIQFTYRGWSENPEEEPVEHTVSETIPEGCEGSLLVGTVMRQVIG